jgi:hypothetical protein
VAKGTLAIGAVLAAYGAVQSLSCFGIAYSTGLPLDFEEPGALSIVFWWGALVAAGGALQAAVGLVYAFGLVCRGIVVGPKRS